MAAPDDSGEWQPIWQPGQDGPVGWTNTLTGEVVPDVPRPHDPAHAMTQPPPRPRWIGDYFNTEAWRDYDARRRREAERKRFLEKFTGLKVE